MQTADHWENVYRSKSFDAVSWYAPHLAQSLRLIEQLCPDKTAAIVDIGGGQSTLVVDLWHDLAVFHFLTDPRARQAYVDRVRRFVKPGGFVLMATFGPNGPLKCSGLDVVRYGRRETAP